MRWYHTAGLGSYVAAYGVIPFAAALDRVCRRPSAGGVLAVSFAAALGTLLHPLFAVAAVLRAPVLIADVGRHDEWRRIAAVSTAAAATTIVIDGPWLYASLRAPNLASVEQPTARM